MGHHVRLANTLADLLTDFKDTLHTSTSASSKPVLRLAQHHEELQGVGTFVDRR